MVLESNQSFLLCICQFNRKYNYIIVYIENKKNPLAFIANLSLFYRFLKSNLYLFQITFNSFKELNLKRYRTKL